MDLPGVTHYEEIAAQAEELLDVVVGEYLWRERADDMIGRCLSYKVEGVSPRLWAMVVHS